MKIISTVFLLFICAPSLVACSSAHKNVQIEIFDQGLNLNQQQIGEEMQRERSPVRFDNGTEATTCKLFLDRLEVAGLSEDIS